MRPSTLCLIVSILLAVMSSVAPVAADDHVVYGADSPEALVERLEGAIAEEDMAEIFRVMEPEAREEAVVMMIAMPAMIIAFSSMGSEMAGAMGEALGDLGGETDAEAQAEMAAAKAEAEAKTEALTGKFEALLGRYGLDGFTEEGLDGAETSDVDQNAIDAQLAKIDQGALVADIFTFMEVEFPDQGGDGSGPFEMSGELTNLQVDGDSATATAGDETVYMTKVDGRWYATGNEAPSDGE